MDTFDLFLIALGNSYTCKTIIYHCDGERTWTTDISDRNKDYSKTLYFAKTNLSQLVLVLNVPGSSKPLPTVETNPRVENIESDSDVEITKVVPGNLFQEYIFVKTEHQSENSDNEVNVSEDIPTSNLKKVSANETQAKSTHGTTLSTDSDHSSDNWCNINHMMLEDETQDYEGESDSSEENVKTTLAAKVYINDKYWSNTSVTEANQLPYDIDGKCIYKVPLDSNKRFASSEDGRPWSHIRESKRDNFYGDRYMSICRGSWECHNHHCPHLIQYGKINRCQFTPKSVCKSCGSMLE